MSQEPRRISDPRSLRALAHPVRNRMLYELAARGSARAADLAQVTGVPANAVSFHLRELAKYHLIEEAPGESHDKRERWWRLASESGFRFRPEDLDDEGKQIIRAFDAHTAAHVHEMLERFFAARLADPEMPGNQGDAPMFLTKPEVEQFGEELVDLMLRWMRHGRERRAAGDVEGRRTYLTLVYTMPQDLAQGPAD